MSLIRDSEAEGRRTAVEARGDRLRENSFIAELRSLGRPRPAGRRRHHHPHHVSLVGATLGDEMDAAVWTAIGLLAATSLGTLFYLGSRIDYLAARLDTRIDAGFARVDTRFDAIESRLDGLASRLDAHLDQHAS
jgi:hypothetical protein